MKKSFFRWERCKNGIKSSTRKKEVQRKYIFITLSTYIMSPFYFVYDRMSLNNAVEIDIGVLSNGLGI